MDATKSNITMVTKLNKISCLSYQDSTMEFKWLMPHFSKENLMICFKELDGKKAVGIDGLTKMSYAQEVENNLEALVKRMKDFSYRSKPVREVMIPKSDGKYRPLGISSGV